MSAFVIYYLRFPIARMLWGAGRVGGDVALTCACLNWDDCFIRSLCCFYSSWLGHISDKSFLAS